MQMRQTLSGFNIQSVVGQYVLMCALFCLILFKLFRFSFSCADLYSACINVCLVFICFQSKTN